MRNKMERQIVLEKAIQNVSQSARVINNRLRQKFKENRDDITIKDGMYIKIADDAMMGDYIGNYSDIRG